MFDVIKHISRSLCKTVKVGLYIYICNILGSTDTRTYIFAQLVCCRQNDGIEMQCIFARNKKEKKKIESTKKSLAMRTSENFCNFFMNAHRHIRSPHIHIFYKEFIERKCKKKQIMLEAWSERMEGFEKKTERRWWFMRKIISCAGTFILCVQKWANTHTHTTHMMSGYEWFSLLRVVSMTENAFGMENIF